MSHLSPEAYSAVASPEASFARSRNDFRNAPRFTALAICPRPSRLRPRRASAASSPHVGKWPLAEGAKLKAGTSRNVGADTLVDDASLLVVELARHISPPPRRERSPRPCCASRPESLRKLAMACRRAPSAAAGEGLSRLTHTIRRDLQAFAARVLVVAALLSSLGLYH